MLRAGGICLFLAALTARSEAQGVPSPLPLPSPQDPAQQDPEPQPPSQEPEPQPAPRDPDAVPPEPEPPARLAPESRSPEEHRPQASDEFIDPSQLPPDEPPQRPPYPRALTMRPLLLPAGRREARFSVGMGREMLEPVALVYGTVTVAGRFASRFLEPYGGVDLVPVHGDNADTYGAELSVPLLQRVYAGSRVRITDDAALGVQAVCGNLFTDHLRFSPSLYAEIKLRPSERGSIQLYGGVDYNYTRDTSTPSAPRSVETASAFATGTAQVQVTPTAAIEVSGAIAQQKILGSYYAGHEYSRAYAYGADLVLSVSEDVDLGPYLSFISNEDLDGVSAGLALNVR